MSLGVRAYLCCWFSWMYRDSSPMHFNSLNFNNMKMKFILSFFRKLGAGFLFFFVITSLPAQIWTQQGADINGEADNDESGRSVALSADGATLAVGANRNANAGILRGHVRVYKLDNGTWRQQGADIDGEANGDQSGWSVALSTDGSIVAIGAPFNNVGSGSQRGHVRVYKYNGSAWIKQGADLDGEAHADYSGWSVA